MREEIGKDVVLLPTLPDGIIYTGNNFKKLKAIAIEQGRSLNNGKNLDRLKKSLVSDSDIEEVKITSITRVPEPSYEAIDDEVQTSDNEFKEVKSRETEFKVLLRVIPLGVNKTLLLRKIKENWKKCSIFVKDIKLVYHRTIKRTDGCANRNPTLWEICAISTECTILALEKTFPVKFTKGQRSANVNIVKITSNDNTVLYRDSRYKFPRGFSGKLNKVEKVIKHSRGKKDVDSEISSDGDMAHQKGNHKQIKQRKTVLKGGPTTGMEYELGEKSDGSHDGYDLNDRINTPDSSDESCSTDISEKPTKKSLCPDKDANGSHRCDTKRESFEIVLAVKQDGVAGYGEANGGLTSEEQQTNHNGSTMNNEDVTINNCPSVSSAEQQTHICYELAVNIQKMVIAKLRKQMIEFTRCRTQVEEYQTIWQKMDTEMAMTENIHRDFYNARCDLGRADRSKCNKLLHDVNKKVIFLNESDNLECVNIVRQLK